MKTLDNNKNYKSTLIVMIMTILSINAYSNENGGNYNGPDLEGKAIPTETDRSFSVVDLQNAYKSCYKREILDLITQLYCGKTYEEKDERIDLTFIGNRPNISAQNPCLSASIIELNLVLVSSKLNNGLAVYLKIGDGNIRVPYFSYDVEIPEGIKSTEGVVSRSNFDKVKVKNLKIHSHEFEGNEEVPLTYDNEGIFETHADFSFNAKAYGDCLLEKIQE